MLEKIFKTFFTEIKKPNIKDNLTVIKKNREIVDRIIENKRKPISEEDGLTCLSIYFHSLKGLNLEERELSKCEHIHK